jgi:hypothetical protein
VLVLPIIPGALVHERKLPEIVQESINGRVTDSSLPTIASEANQSNRKASCQGKFPQS